MVDSDRGRIRPRRKATLEGIEAIETGTDLIQALSRAQRGASANGGALAGEPREIAIRRASHSGIPFPRCVLVVLAHRGDHDGLARFLARIPAELTPLFAEIAVLCDGEPDALAPPPIADLGIANVRWRANPRRYGYGGRRKVAFEYALEHGFDQVLVADVDDEDAPLELAAVWAPAVLDEAEIVVGAPAHSTPAARANALLLNRILGMRLRGWGSSLRLYSCAMLRRIPYALDSDGERFDTEILLQCRALGVDVREVQLARGRSRGGSIAAAVAYRMHQLHLARNGAFLVDRDVHYSLKHSPYGSHMQVLDAIRPGSRVLDLGCSQGLLAKALRAKNVSIVGVDIGPPDRVSRELEAYHRRDLEQALEIPEAREFDYVVLSDVIEHVKEREQLLRSARRYLKPDGRLLISTPNIAIWFYRLSLLAGRFEYGPRGVLDETHVHLYTRSTFRREVERGGFKIRAERVTALPFELVFESTGQSRLVAALSGTYYALARIYPKMFAYQFLLEAEVTTVLDPQPKAKRS